MRGGNNSNYNNRAKKESLFVHPCFLLLYLVIIDVVIVSHELVDGALWSELYDAVGHSIDELVVVGSKEYIALKGNKVVVERLNGLKVKVVGRRIENETVGILELHTRNHTPHLLTTREYLYFLLNLFLLEEHASEEALHHDLIACAEL